jgi:TfoX/Sxy family transcriptional regulator of competence genes
MSTEQSFVEYVQSQSGLGSELSFRKMFGEYALYLHGRVVAFACDNQLYLKPTAEVHAVVGKVSEAPPYPGGKLHFQLDEQLEDRELLRRLLVLTAGALPLPQTNAARGAKSKPARKSASAKSAKPSSPGA